MGRRIRLLSPVRPIRSSTATETTTASSRSLSTSRNAVSPACASITATGTKATASARTPATRFGSRANATTRVGIFGFSFGGAIATLAGVDENANVIALLAPASRLTDELDAAAALNDVEVPLKVLYGSRDDLADWKPLVERAKELGFETEEFPADHFFVGQETKVAGKLGEFLVEQL